MSVDAQLRIGTSGWVYPHWTGLFYPPACGRSSGARLAFLATRFTSVEVNATFYSLVRPATCDAWRARVPASFVFAVKASRYITHNLRLGLSAGIAPLANFFAQGILRLGAQLGPILWQLPPQLSFDRERARRFLESLPQDMGAAERLARRHDHRLAGRAALRAPDGRALRLRHAFEVRHPSWLSDLALRTFADAGAALVVADSAGVHPMCLAQTADFLYVRLHGAEVLYASRYTDEEIAAWCRRIRRWMKTQSPAYVYFDNDNKAHATGDAERLRARLERRRAAPCSAAPPAHVADRVDRFCGAATSGASTG